MTALLLGCVLAPQVLPWFCDYAGGRLIGLGWQIPRLLVGWARPWPLVIALLLRHQGRRRRLAPLGRVLVRWPARSTLVGTRLAIRLALGERVVARALTCRIAVIGLGDQLHRDRRPPRRRRPRRPASPSPRSRRLARRPLAARGRPPCTVSPSSSSASMPATVDQVVLAMPGPDRRPARAHLAQPAPSRRRCRLGPRPAPRPRARAGHRPARRRARWSACSSARSTAGTGCSRRSRTASWPPSCCWSWRP